MPHEKIAPLNEHQIAAQTGTAFTVQKGQIIRIIDVEGQQVADLVCFAGQNQLEYLSSGRSIDYNEKLNLSTGDILYSSRSNPMLSITRDPVGRHDFLFAPCSQEMFRLTYNTTGPHPNCLDNLANSLSAYGIRDDQIPTAFNIFMNVAISPTGRVSVETPLSEAGDFIDLRAEMDLIVGVSACSAGKCNNFQCTPIRVEIYPQKA